MRGKSRYVVVLIVFIFGGGYWVVNTLNSSKQVTVENKELMLQNKEMTKENKQLSKTVSRLEELKEGKAESSPIEEKEVSEVESEIPVNEKLEKINEEFVSVSFNFEDSTDRSNNMKAYMTEELKANYIKNNETSKMSELESIKVSGELKDYKMYTDSFISGKINVINDVTVTYTSGDEKTDHRMMFVVSYDVKTWQVQEIQFLPVINTD